MSDFSPATRNAAIWGSDSGSIAIGKANEVILIKQGKHTPEDPSGLERVQIGKKIQSFLGELASEKLQANLIEVEDSYTHPKHTWLKTHIDFVAEGKGYLVETKNLDINQRKHYDPDAGIVHPRYYHQCLHEAIVYGVDTVYLACLFGGNEFVTIRLDFTSEQKEDWIKKLAEVWGHIQAGTTMPPESVEQCKMLYPVDMGMVRTASQSVEQACQLLALVKSQIKELEKREDILQTTVAGYMQDSSVLTNIEGHVLATWKNAKTSSSFDKDLFRSAMPDIYEQFVVNKQGSRRFLLK